MSISVFLGLFSFFFLAAAPGRTTFVLIALASKGPFRRLFFGAAAAFFVQSLFSILLGEVLGRLPQSAVEFIAGIAFLYFGYAFWRQSQRAEEFVSRENSVSAKEAFVLVGVAELGDVSQLAIATVAAKSASKVSVFIAAISALWVLCALALWIGKALKRVINPGLIQKLAGLAFVGIGLFFIVKAAGFF